MADGKARKIALFKKVGDMLDTHDRFFLVLVDNVRSSQIQQVRKALRGKAEVLMGKNTLIRKVVRSKNNPDLEKICDILHGNLGFVFCKGDMKQIRDVLLANRVGAPARAGTFAPCDVFVPPGPTGQEPTKTSFFQALNINTKINKGQVEIINEVHLIKKGDKVDASKATLLQMLNIKPFSYGLEIKAIYDCGSLYGEEVLNMSDDVLVGKFQSGVANIAAASLELGYPTLAALPHMMARGFRNLLAVTLETDYTFPKAAAFKEAAKAPAAAPVAAAGKKEEPKKGEKKEEPKKKEPEPEPEPEDMGMGLFD